MKAWRLVAGVLLVSLGLLPALPVRAEGPLQVWVDDSYCAACENDGHVLGADAFTSLSEGLRAVASGGTVKVRPGRYQEDLRITRPCTIVAEGSGAVVVTPRFAQSTVTIASNNVTIEGLEIAGGAQAAILVLGPDYQRKEIRDVTLRRNVIRGGYFGIAVNIASSHTLGLLPTSAPEVSNSLPCPWDYGVLPAGDIEISNNTISGCKRGIYVYNTEADISGNSISGTVVGGIGIYSSRDSRSRISTNTVKVDAPNGRAVYVLDNVGTVVEGNTFVGSTDVLTPTTAMALNGYGDLLVSKNTVKGFHSGMSAYTGGTGRFTGNLFDGTLGSSLSLGTTITTTTVTVEGNTFRGAYVGLHLNDDGGYGLDATVRGNAFSDNVVGIQLAASVRAGQVGVHGNAICGNIAAGLRNEAKSPADATDNWWGANDGPKPAGSGDRVEGAGGADVSSWLRLAAISRTADDGKVAITASVGNSRYSLRDWSVTFRTDRGAFVETDSASLTTLTDRRGEAVAVLYPLQGAMANVTIGSGCGQSLVFGVPAVPAAAVALDARGSPRPAH